MHYLARFVLLLETLLLLGCSPADGPDTHSTKRHDLDSINMLPIESLQAKSERSTRDLADPINKLEHDIVATIGNRDIALEELDALIRIKKFDLEWALYELRQVTLTNYASSLVKAQKSLESNDIDILLTPPMPPRIAIPDNKRYVIGKADAPIKLAIFCSYQSSPCMRIQPIIAQLKLLYEGLVSLVPYDFPMHFHRNGRSAANAARCAASALLLEPYQQGLYADINNLNDNRYKQIAGQIGLHLDDFARCYEENEFDHLIQDDIDFGQSLNAGNVPLIFINGLYTKGPKTIATYIYYIESELKRLGIDVKSSDPSASTSEQDASEPLLVQEGELTTGRDKPIIDNRQVETSKMILSREWLDAHLLNQIELEESFTQAEHLVNEQYYLMRLENIAETDFYETLGLKERDVIMKVNEKWLHSGENSLFDAFHNNEQVSIIVMRKGLPYRYDFEIQ
jgi:protein-disulfide isomerase